jgi:NAD(P)-dependent dehydrogenase (short-subunit alcohol dehydrogenase family)
MHFIFITQPRPTESTMGILARLFGAAADPNYYIPESLLAADLSGTTASTTTPPTTRRAPRSFRRRQCAPRASFAVVTGATGVFGCAVSEALVKQGATVVLAVRRLEAGEALAAQINAKGHAGSALAMRLELTSLASVRAFAADFAARHSALHVLVENAAVCCVGNTPVEATGFEPHLAANHYGHVYLRHHLEPILAASAPSRVVVVASALHDRLFTQEPTTLDLDAPPSHLGFTADPQIDQLKQWMAYARTKLCNVLSALAASERLAAQGVKIVSVHPGVDVSTGIFRNMPKGAFVMGLLGRFIGVQSTDQSVQTILFGCLAPHAELRPGAFYSQWYKAKYRDGQLGGMPMMSPNPLVTAENAAKLEALSYRALGLEPPAAAKQPAAATDGISLDVQPTPATRDVALI